MERKFFGRYWKFWKYKLGPEHTVTSSYSCSSHRLQLQVSLSNSIYSHTSMDNIWLCVLDFTLWPDAWSSIPCLERPWSKPTFVASKERCHVWGFRCHSTQKTKGDIKRAALNQRSSSPVTIHFHKSFYYERWGCISSLSLNKTSEW